MSGSSGLTPTEIDQIRSFCGYPAEEALPVMYQPPVGTVEISGSLQGLTLAPIPLLNAGIRGNSLMLNQILATLTPERLAKLRSFYLPNLVLLEEDIPGVRGNLDTDKADVWSRNRTEMAEREALFDSLRVKLCRYLGVSPGDGIGPQAPAAFFV